MVELVDTLDLGSNAAMCGSSSLPACTKAEDFSSAFVRAGRLELPHLAASDPKSDVSTNSTTPA